MSALVSPIATPEIAGTYTKAAASAMDAMVGNLRPEARVRLLIEATRNTLGLADGGEGVQ